MSAPGLQQSDGTLHHEANQTIYKNNTRNSGHTVKSSGARAAGVHRRGHTATNAHVVCRLAERRAVLVKVAVHIDQTGGDKHTAGIVDCRGGIALV